MFDKEIDIKTEIYYPFTCKSCNMRLYNQMAYTYTYLCYCEKDESMYCQKCYFFKHKTLIERKSKYGNKLITAIVPCIEIIKLDN